MNKYFSTTDLSVAGSAINSYYGGSVNVNYSTSSILIISGSVLTDKYVRLFTAGGRIQAEYSGSWVSGSTLVSPVQFFPNYNSGTQTAINWVMCPNLLLISTFLSTVVSKTGFIGKLNNGQYIVAGSCYTSGYEVNGRCINTSTGLDVFMQPLLYQNYKTSNNKYFKMRPFFCCAVNGISTYSGSPAYIPDLYLSTVNMPNNAIYSGSGIFLSPGVTMLISSAYAVNQTTFSKCPFLIENVEPL